MYNQLFFLFFLDPPFKAEALAAKILLPGTNGDKLLDGITLLEKLPDQLELSTLINFGSYGKGTNGLKIIIYIYLLFIKSTFKKSGAKAITKVEQKITFKKVVPNSNHNRHDDRKRNCITSLQSMFS